MKKRPSSASEADESASSAAATPFCGASRFRFEPTLGTAALPTPGCEAAARVCLVASSDWRGEAFCSERRRRRGGGGLDVDALAREGAAAWAAERRVTTIVGVFN